MKLTSRLTADTPIELSPHPRPSGQKATYPMRSSNFADAFSPSLAPLPTDDRRANWELIDGTKWEFLATVTLGCALKRTAAERCFRRGLERLQDTTPEGLDWLVSVETDYEGGRTHVHALLAADGALTVLQVTETWQVGLRRIRRPQAGETASSFRARLIPGDITEHTFCIRPNGADFWMSGTTS